MAARRPGNGANLWCSNMMPPLRVLFLEPCAQISGGGIALLRLISALDRKAFRPLVVLGSAGPLMTGFRRIPGCRVLCRPLAPSLSRVTRFNVFTGGLLNARAAVAYGFWLRRLADQWGADIIHSNGLKMDLFSILMIRREKRLLIWHIRDYIAPPYMPERSARLVRYLVRRVPDVIICNSVSTRRSLGEPLKKPIVEGGGKAFSRLPGIHTVPDGVRYSGDGAAFRSGQVPIRRRVLMLGRVAEWKGQHVFVRAASRLCQEDPDTEFIIAGGATTEADSLYERQLRASVEAAGLSRRIVFLGMVQDVPSLLQSSDVLVHCSISPEPLGQVIIEAMAATVPVVAANLGAPAEIIRDGVDGRLYTAGDHAGLAHVLRELLDDPAARCRLAMAGRQTVEERFGLERTVNQISEIYRRHTVRSKARGGFQGI